MIGPSKVLLGAFLSATALAVGAAAYSQAAGSLWDSTQLPETRGVVKQYTLTPRGDVDGLILNDGTEVTLPPHARVPYPADAYAFIAQLVWVQSGQLTLTDGSVRRVLAPGDTFELGQPRSREFRNETAEECRYVVVVTRKSTA